MSTPDRSDRDLESLLRRALHEQAERVQPLGDGLAKIQQRTAQRRRTWLRPTLAALAAAVAVVGALGVPALLHRSQPGSGINAAASSPPQSRPATPHATSPITPRSTADTPTRYVPAWPYSTATEALHGKNSPALRSPATLATSFVYSFVSTVSVGVSSPVKLVAKGPRQTSATSLTVDVIRADLGRSVCQVRLARLAGSPTSYVVTGATASDLTVRATSKAQGAVSVQVGGTYRPVSDPVAKDLWSAVVVPDGSTTPTLKASSPNEPTSRWSTQLNAQKQGFSGPAVVAAWTVDGDGNVLDFAAAGTR